MSTVSSRFESSFRGGLVERCSRHTRSSRTPSPFRLLVLADALGWRSVSRETEALISFDRPHFVATEPVLSTLRAPILRWCTEEQEIPRSRLSFSPYSRGEEARQAHNRCIGPCRMPRSGQRMQEQHQPPGPYTTSLFSFHVKPAFNEQSARQTNPRFALRHCQAHVSRETAIEPLTPSNDRRGLAKPQRAWGVLM